MINDLSQTEENYLKAIFHLSDDENNSISTNAISNKIATTAASVTDMIKKLKDSLEKIRKQNRVHVELISDTGGSSNV